MSWHFPIFILVSFVAFIGVLRLALRERPRTETMLWVAGVVVIGGMVFAKIGTAFGWPVWIYYGVPALLTWVLPPVVFRMRVAEFARYLPMSLVLAPLIHVFFSFFLGWHEYMPFITIPSFREIQ